MWFWIFVLIVAMVSLVVYLIMSQNDLPAATQRVYNSNQQPEIYVVKVLQEGNARIEAMIQADEAGHPDVRQRLLDDVYSGHLPERRTDGGWTSIFDNLRILSIAGINHRQGIGRYTGRNMVALVPEPQNEFDVNAIKVLAEDGHHLGYIQRHQTEIVRSWARDEFPMYCACRIEEREDEDDNHRFYVGYLYVILKK